MYHYLKVKEAVAKHSGAMEAETILINGVSLKNHTSRRNFLRKLVFSATLLVLSSLIVSVMDSCVYGGGQSSQSTSGTTINKDVQKLVNMLKEAIYLHAMAQNERGIIAAENKHEECEALVKEMENKYKDRRYEFFKLVDDELNKRKKELYVGQSDWYLFVLGLFYDAFQEEALKSLKNQISYESVY